MPRGLGALIPLCAVQLFAATSFPFPANSFANAVQVDSSGNLYVAGSIVANPQTANSPTHVFVAKFTPDGSKVIWSATLSGSQSDSPQALALGSDNSVYITGDTTSPDFPTTPGSMQSHSTESPAAFAAKYDANGKLVYSTFLPTGNAQAIAVDAAGDAFITGPLFSTDTFSPTPGTVAGAPKPPQTGLVSGYAIELNPTGSSSVLAISGFGGNQIALDSMGNMYLVGAFTGPLAPTTPGAFQTTSGSARCVSGIFFQESCGYQHIAKIDPTGTHLVYATYLAGAWGAAASGLAVDSAGNAILAGTTSSPDYPTTSGGYQPEFFANPNQQAAGLTFTSPPSTGFVTKLNATGTGLVWSTLLGGSGGPAGSFLAGDMITAMAIDPSGNILLEGAASSSDFPGLWNVPVASRPKSGTGISPSAFITRLSADGTTLSATQLFGSGFGVIAARPDGSALVAGSQITGVTLPSPGRIVTICDAADDAKIVAVAPGQLLTLYGTNLAPQGSAATSAAFPTSLNGVTVTFNGIPAPILYTSAIQINLQVPYEVAGQAEVTMKVTSQSVSPAISESYILAVVPRQPSVFLAPAAFQAPYFDNAQCGSQTRAGVPALAVNADGSLNSCANPAAPNSTVTLFVNGLGVTTPAQLTGAVSSSAVAVNPTAVSGPSAVPTTTVPGSTDALVQIQVQVGTASSLLSVALQGAPGSVPLPVRSPGVVIWVSSPSSNTVQ